MKRPIAWAAAAAAVLLTATLAAPTIVRAHCEIPCGIYDDGLRIHEILENIDTVEKSMKQIDELSKEPSKNMNQIVRWVMNKEEHADGISHVATQYFMTQRLKPVGADDAKHAAYAKQLGLLHALMVHSMKMKQTTDVAHCEAARKLVAEFKAAYFKKEDIEHLDGHHPINKP